MDNDATERIRLLEDRIKLLQGELRLAQASANRMQYWPHTSGITAPLYNWVRYALHPDRVVDPEARTYLNRCFLEFEAQVQKAGGSNLPTREEMMRNAARLCARRGFTDCLKASELSEANWRTLCPI